MRRVFLIHASEAVDDPDAKPQRFDTSGLSTLDYRIAPLSAGWHSALPERVYRCGAGPLEALADATRAVRAGRAEVAVLHGEDLLKSAYTREERHRGMNIFSQPLPHAYGLLAEEFCRIRGISPAGFEACRDALWENHLRVWRELHGEQAPCPDDRWLENLSPWHRGVDCANPLIDYRAEVVLASEEALEKLPSPPRHFVEVAGVGLGALDVDGPEHVAQIARFAHLAQALESLRREAGEDFVPLAAQGSCLLEVYTCYPVVPLAFLLVSGLADTTEGVLAFLKSRDITVTGGMNLARAPWNCPALRGLVAVYRRMEQTGVQHGLVHGNGGLGARQGVALLRGR